jgi:serine/threonine protein kinase/Tol biopolymer transport system component
MTLTSGTRLGPYEVVAAIGAGGMGEVYRAKDTKLGRDVAIKVLPAAFAQDPERLARFEREARVLASLNHTNIAHVYGFESVTVPDGSAAHILAMEMVEGEDLAERLKRGAIPVDEALAIARQIADGLEEAHDKGIVHRDLKPANIKVTPDGRVKILDFGLAKAYEGHGASSTPDLSHSPTMSRHMTEAGLIMGTAAYMSPEQARGKTVDKRADIWSFGVVLFEMLAGARTFAGETVSDTLAAVLMREIDWTKLPGNTPPAIDRLLRRCLDRDVRHRLQSIAEARIVLEAPVTAETTKGSASSAGPDDGRRHVMRVLPWLIAAAAIVFALWPGRGSVTPKAPPPIHVDVSLPPDIEPVPSLEASFALSPDGRMVAITAFRGGSRRLHVRRLASDETFEVGDSDGVNLATFSPQGDGVAFVTNSGVLSRASLADQQRERLAEGVDLTGGLAWGKSGIAYVRNSVIWLKPEGGGPERQVTKLDEARHEVLHANLHFLPDGRTLLFSGLTTQPGEEHVEAVSVLDGTRTSVMEHASTPLWSPTGHLLFARDGALLAMNFDAVTLKATGAATRVIAKGTVATTMLGGLSVRLSPSGDLLLLPTSYRAARVAAVNRAGAVTILPFPLARYLNPRVSPDGRRVMVEVQSLRLDALDLDRQTISRLTAEAPGTVFSLWNSDGTAIVFKRFNAPYWIATDGSGRGGPVPAGVTNDFLSGQGPDPDSFLCTRISAQNAADIFLMSISGKFAPKPLIATPAYEGGAQLSRDGRWLVYVTSESGRLETAVRRYPSLERKWQVSSGFGVQPRWRTDGREIYYRDGENMMAVPFDGSKDEPVIGKPVALFKDEYDLGQGVTNAAYDVTRDGGFILLRRDAKGAGLSLILNWTEELKEIIARGGVN